MKPTHLMLLRDQHYLVRPGAEKDDGIVKLCWVTDQGAVIEHDAEDLHWVIPLTDIEEKCL